MERIHVPVEKPYNVFVGESLLDNIGLEVKKLAPKSKKIAIISDNVVFPLYGQKVIESFSKTNLEVIHYIFPAGESSKNKNMYFSILEWLSENLVTRQDTILALGGGVTGDIAGFCASTYLRGIDYVQLPTTLLAAVDSSVGGKTGINLPTGKNLVGSFWQPLGVFCDTETFDTLSPEIFADGVAEMIKYGCIWDAELFEVLSDTSWKKDRFSETIARCVRIKAEIVANDERDFGLRQILNFGHTLGHAIEQLSGFTLSHGKCVGIGMVSITNASERAELTKSGTTKKIKNILELYKLPNKSSYLLEDITEISLGDKKRQGNIINIIVLKEIGKGFIHPVVLDKYTGFLKGAI